MTNEERQAIEKQIATRIVDDALKQGYAISVYNGGDDPEISKATDRDAILENMFGTDEDELHFWVLSTEPNTRAGWVKLVYGNDGYDVIANYVCTNPMDAILKGGQELATEIEEKADV